MKPDITLERRKFVKLAVGSAIAVPFFATARTFASGHLVKVEENDPQAIALGYNHNSATVDGSTFPTHDPAQICSGCNLYQGNEDDEWGPCDIFPGKEVSANGWCTAFVPKPS